MVEWTDEQQAILDYWQGAEENVAVNALAGSGKTTLILGAMALHPDERSIYTAFMKKNVTDVGGDLVSQSHEAQTLNSIGSQTMYAWMKKNNIKAQRVSQFKYWNIVEKMLPAFNMSKATDNSLFMDVVDMCGVMRAYLADTSEENIISLGEMYGIETPTTVIVLIQNAIRMGREGLYNGLMDFDDQIWGPYTLALGPINTYDRVYIDEAQDLSKAKLWLASQLVSENGRVMITGDLHQSIMGFSGADIDSFPNAVRLFKCKSFNVTQSFRFGPNIANLSKVLVPGLIGASSHPGKVSEIDVVPRTLSTKDAIICRYNKPLVKLAMELLHSRIPFYMHSDKLKDRMLRVLGDIKNANFENIVSHIMMHESLMLSKMRLEHKSARHIATFEETMECLLVAAQQSAAKNMLGFTQEIEDIFKKRDGVTLITAHAAKGSQWNRVYLLGKKDFGKQSEKLPDWMNTQESNVYYVALTRPREELIWIDPEYQVEQAAPNPQADIIHQMMKEEGITLEDLLNAGD